MAGWSLGLALLRFLLILTIVAPSAVLADQPRLTGPTDGALSLQAVPPPANPDFFGIVGRDPLFTLDVDGHTVASEAPAEFLDRMAADLAHLGARWVRLEFHAVVDQAAGPGRIDYAKYDYFIFETAPRHGLKVLALLNSGMLRDADPYYWLPRLEDPPDGAGSEPADRSNNYSRAFANRAREIAGRYGDAIAAYELFNEPNINTHKYLLTGGRAHELSPERIGTLATNTALAIRAVSPRARLVLGGLLHGSPVERPGRQPSDYLADLYQSPRVQWFFTNRPLGRDRPFPWDAVALHPYDLAPWQVESHLREVKARLATVGDTGSRLWVTEIGRQAEPPPLRSHWLMPPTLQEQQQADYLTQVYSRLLAMPDVVERVFWFKYEDFRENGLPRNWGLVRLREQPGGYYDPAMTPYPRKSAYLAYQQLANPAAVPTTPRPLLLGQPLDSRYFPTTGQSVSGPFLRYWEQQGGLARFGLPRTTAFMQGGRLVQYFERARFEHHPELGGAQAVQLGLLGQFLIGETPAGRPSPPLVGQPSSRYFPETRHNLSNGFKAHWEQYDGLRHLGLPISEEFVERTADGHPYTVQYFERGRLEYHPALRGTPFEIQRGLVGNQIIAAQTWYR